MEGTTSVLDAKKIMNGNFIGPTELELISKSMGFKVPTNYPEIPFSNIELVGCEKDYILILGASQMQNGEQLTLESLRSHFGINPDISEPCFYNQDWYLNEDFIIRPLKEEWYLVSKELIKESRGKELNFLKSDFKFPSAVLCAFTFFSYWFYSKKILWENDYVWCSDNDFNEDKIYVGRYKDNNGINKNGFSIHRHLKIKEFYGCIDVF